MERRRRTSLPKLRDRDFPFVGDGVKHTACRVCDHSPLLEYLDLGTQPLANAFLKPDDTSPEFTAPLTIALCPECGLSQLTEVVSPDRLYQNYVYCSGVSESWREHCSRLAQEYTREHVGERFVIDIGANDGTMLDAFDRIGHRVLGVDPAAMPTGLPILPLYWNEAVGQHVADRHGKADCIIATNVLGHVDDVRGFLRGIAAALDPYGIAIIEAPHIMPLLYLNAFDTIYHEHLSYWSLGPLQRAVQSAGLAVFDVKPQPIHGGTMRYYLCHAKLAHLTDNLAGLWKREQVSGLKTLEPYEDFGTRVRAVKPKLQEAFAREGLHGWGASAKGNVLLNYIEANLPVIYDEAPTKQGLQTPGRHIPVKPLPADLSEVSCLALLSWNWARELKVKAKARGFTGEYLTPIPTPRWDR